MQINPIQLHGDILKLAKAHSFSIEVIYQIQPISIIALKKKSRIYNAPHIYISAGIHGDEPAGPMAIENLLKDHFFNDTVNWYLIPMLNPQGLLLGTRVNADGVDLNRDYIGGKTKEVAAHLQWLKKNRDIHFDLTISLHEDWESPGFYCYAIVPSETKGILVRISQAVKELSPINLAQEIEGAKAKDGFILHKLEDFQKILDTWQDWPEAFFLINNQPNSLHFTFETASGQPLEQRIHTHCAAIKAATSAFMIP